mgnify:CR=1 FL=1
MEYTNIVLLRTQNEAELAFVLGHEITHIANGDMVTMTLLQGIMNAFVMFFARLVGPGKVWIQSLPFSRLAGRVLANASPVGGNAIDYLVTVLRPEGLIYIVFVAPEKEFAKYERTFRDMIDSIRFTRW